MGASSSASRHRPGGGSLLEGLLRELAAEPGHQEHLRLRDHEPAELAFYSRATTDIEYAFPFTDWGELWGIADRTNYDLTRHQGFRQAWSTMTRRPMSTMCPMSSAFSGLRPWSAFPVRGIRRGASGGWQGQGGRAHCAASASALAPYKCAVLLSRSWAKGNGDPQPAEQSTLWWTMTIPVPSVSVTAVRTRSAPVLHHGGL